MCGSCNWNFPSPSCGSPECAVCECKKELLPCDSSGKCFLEPPKKPCSTVAQQKATHSFLDRSLEGGFKPYAAESLPALWASEETDDGAIFVDLRKNIERWTGDVIYKKQTIWICGCLASCVVCLTLCCFAQGTPRLKAPPRYGRPSTKRTASGVSLYAARRGSLIASSAGSTPPSPRIFSKGGSYH
jgi:hypothetical protein